MYRFFVLLCLFTLKSFAQDTIYARDVIRQLTSKSFFGRGYVKNGLQKAESFIINEIKKQKTFPLFGKTYTQTFIHSVNTFPKTCDVKLNGKELEPGIDYILNPNSPSIKGKFNLIKKDSSFYSDNSKVNVLFKNKLTYRVSSVVDLRCEIELDKHLINQEPKFIELNIQNKFLPFFKSKNIACFLPGLADSDSMLVFCAHYDHLGGMGSNTFFPGANDNASGVSVLLNLIKFYAANPPKYKIVFIFFAGEEAGLLGSKAFIESKTIPLNKIKFLINLDLLGTGNNGIMVVNGNVHEKEFNRLNLINSENRYVNEIKKRGKAANSDHYWFSENGVPCFFIYTLGGPSAYHDVNDVEKNLPLTDYVDVFKLITEFSKSF